ncbi:MAG: restriction endonuclease subunit R, partial [Phycisphaerae bacterium]|nr:restriction endonuclease subunit R [Phycisphaerae bacterium]
RGGMGKKPLIAAQEKLNAVSEDKSNLILATGRYLGEGFDHSRLDTLFLALPVSWKGTIAQYAGRLHRDHHSKREVIIYDYADINVPMLAKMFSRRLRGYKAIGYKVSNNME